jgi:hypothetical protein
MQIEKNLTKLSEAHFLYKLIYILVPLPPSITIVLLFALLSAAHCTAITVHHDEMLHIVIVPPSRRPLHRRHCCPSQLCHCVP